MRLGNNFASEEQSMSLDSFAVPLAKKGLLNKQKFLLFTSFLFLTIYFILFFLNLVIMKRRENT